MTLRHHKKATCMGNPKHEIPRLPGQESTTLLESSCGGSSHLRSANTRQSQQLQPEGKLITSSQRSIERPRWGRLRPLLLSWKRIYRSISRIWRGGRRQCLIFMPACGVYMQETERFAGLFWLTVPRRIGSCRVRLSQKLHIWGLELTNDWLERKVLKMCSAFFIKRNDYCQYSSKKPYLWHKLRLRNAHLHLDQIFPYLEVDPKAVTCKRVLFIFLLPIFYEPDDGGQFSLRSRSQNWDEHRW
jgi:hypothetical protein